jgi:alpha-1,6-mannosyltransferase
MVRRPPRPGDTAGFLALFFAVFGVYAAVAWWILGRGASSGSPPARVVPIIVFFATLFRLTLLPAAPALSDDIYRYLWDGRVVAAGLNPYLDPPAAPDLAALRDDLHARVAHQQVRTIYPPVAQALFAMVAASGAGVAGLKTLLILADLIAIALLGGLLTRLRLPPARLALYAWNPLVVIEVAWSGHLEPVGVALTLLAAGAIIQKRDLRSTIALTLAALVKILPLALFAPFLR